MLKIIADECLHVFTKDLLIKMGFEVLEVNDILEWGCDDIKIYNYAIDNKLPIITHDRGFGRLFIESDNSPLTIILQVLSPHPESTNELLSVSFDKINIVDMSGSQLIIIDKSKIRIRKK